MKYLDANLNLYKTFIAVYEARKISGASVNIGIAEPTINYQIRELEKMLGAKLFTSHSRGVEPTSEADTLYPSAMAAISTLEKAAENLRTFDENSEAKIRMILPTTMAVTTLGHFFRDFRKKYPKIELEIYSRAQQENYNLFSLGQVDFVIDTDDICKKQNLKTIDFLTLNLVFIASKKFLIMNGFSQIIDKNDLSKLALIGHVENIKKIINETELELSPYIKTSSYEPIYPLVRLGTGIGLFTREYMENQDNDDVVELTIKNFNMQPQIKISCGYDKSRLTKASMAFIDDLLAFIQKN